MRTPQNAARNLLTRTPSIAPRLAATEVLGFGLLPAVSCSSWSERVAWPGRSLYHTGRPMTNSGHPPTGLQRPVEKVPLSYRNRRGSAIVSRRQLRLQEAGVSRGSFDA